MQQEQAETWLDFYSHPAFKQFVSEFRAMVAQEKEMLVTMSYQDSLDVIRRQGGKIEGMNKALAYLEMRIQDARKESKRGD